MSTYTYLNADDRRLTSSIPQQRFKLESLLNYTIIQDNGISED